RSAPSTRARWISSTWSRPESSPRICCRRARGGPGALRVSPLVSSLLATSAPSAADCFARRAPLSDALALCLLGLWTVGDRDPGALVDGSAVLPHHFGRDGELALAEASDRGELREGPSGQRQFEG